MTIRFPHLALIAYLVASSAGADEPAAGSRVEVSEDGESAAAIRSEATWAVGLEVDRDESRLIAFTFKPRALVREAVLEKSARRYVDGEPVQFEVRLLGPQGSQFTARVDTGPLCLMHDGDAEPHVEGDTIRLHRDTFIVELPVLPDFDAIDVAYHDGSKSSSGRRVLGTHFLDPSRRLEVPQHREASGTATTRRVQAPPSKSGATVLWPEDFGETTVYRVFGSAADAERRINVTLIPDGYTYAERAAMDADAERLVQAFRAKSPYRELDPYINYTLVYAYSNETGTDQCDCGIVADTAMGSRFPAGGGSCGASANRCLYYGGTCDAGRNENIVAAELRAPVHDETVIMVNTTRYGGCGGSRAVYSAGNASAVEIAIHELGHSLAGLSDEYGGISSCGISGGSINTSTNATVGNWPEWIDDLGAPRQGGRYYESCIYRPAAKCEMRSLFQEFCPVCKQHWALTVLSHPRVAPTAPIAALKPGEPSVAWSWQSTRFEVATRLPDGIPSTVEWYLQGPGDPEPVLVQEGGTAFEHSFGVAGPYRLQVLVIAATEMIKRTRWGPNRDTGTFLIDVRTPEFPDEISPAHDTPLHFADTATLRWEDAADRGVSAYNVYRGTTDGIRAGNVGSCFRQGLTVPTATDAQHPLPGIAWTYLITGSNGLGEGSPGSGSGDRSRDVVSPCR